MASFQEEFLRKQKEAKERERSSRLMASQAARSFRGGSDVADKDLQLKKVKDQDRIKKQEAQKHRAAYQDVTTVSEVQEAQQKKVEARQKQLATQMEMSKPNSVVVPEYDLKLQRLREEDRSKHQEAQQFMQSVQFNDVKYQKRVDGSAEKKEKS